jgi:hypothetical protein
MSEIGIGEQNEPAGTEKKQQPTDDGMMNQLMQGIFTKITKTEKMCSHSPEAASPPKKRMALEAPVPVAQEKQPGPVNEQPMDLLMQGIDINANY